MRLGSFSRYESFCSDFRVVLANYLVDAGGVRRVARRKKLRICKPIRKKPENFEKLYQLTLSDPEVEALISCIENDPREVPKEEEDASTRRLQSCINTPTSSIRATSKSGATATSEGVSRVVPSLRVRRGMA